MNIGDLKKLIRLFESSSVSELSLEQDGSKVVLKKGGDFTPAAAVQPATPVSPAPNPHVVGPSLAESALPGVGNTPVATQSKYRVIASPMVGTFYRTSSPTSQPYTDEGKTVRKGDVLCIIEAMKLMNEIESEVGGKIIRIFPENGKPVEYGEPLFEIDPE